MSAAMQRTTPPQRNTRLKLHPDERWLIVGKTGSGKSILARWINRQYLASGWPILIIDPKRRYVDVSRGATFATSPDESSLLHPWRINGPFADGVRVQIYLPEGDAMRDPKLNALFFQALHHGGMVLDIEDISQIADESHLGKGLQACYQEGRAADLVMLTLGQSLVGLPRVAPRQSENYIFFRMTDPEDLDRQARLLGDRKQPRFMRPIERYEFWYKHESDDFGRLMRPLSPAEAGVQPSEVRRS